MIWRGILLALPLALLPIGLVAQQAPTPPATSPTDLPADEGPEPDPEAAEPTPAMPPLARPGTVVQVENGTDTASGATLSPILTVNEEALYSGSAWGQRVQAELEARSVEIAADNERIYNELAAEEDRLTALRSSLTAEEFRKRANAFDTNAQEIRAERQLVVQELNELAEHERRVFFSAAVPVFAGVMEEREALVILDQRMVFISADLVDVTEVLIDRIDAEIGAGPLDENADEGAEAETQTPADPTSDPTAAGAPDQDAPADVP